MRRSDREIKEFDKIIEVIRKCDVCRVGLNDDGYPYILPLNFGMEMEDGKIALYFHGATEGKKYELIKKDNRASFEMDCSHRLIVDEEKGYCTMCYESVMGRGHIEILGEDETYRGLCILMKQYHPEGDFAFNQAAMPRTTMMKLVVDEVTGKARRKDIK